MRRSNNIFSHIDWLTIGLFIVLCLFGWLNIYGASYSVEDVSIFDFNNRAGKQFVWLIGAIVLGLVILLVDEKIYDSTGYFVYALMLLILIATRFVTHPIKGSYSWLTLGPVSLQPAEFAKCITAIALAKFMGRYEYRMQSWKDLFIPSLIIGIPAAIIIVLQHETGSALVFAAFLLVFYRQGMSGYVLWCVVAAIALFILSIRFSMTPLSFASGDVGPVACMLILTVIEVLFLCKENPMKWQELILLGSIVLIYAIAILLNLWIPVSLNWISLAVVIALAIYGIVISLYFHRWNIMPVALFAIIFIGYTQTCDWAFHDLLQDHQRSRIEVLLGMKDDPSGVGYNVNQSKIAIGSGGLTGKGYLEGTQTKLQYVPEQDTDFIFCTVGEEWGFIGTSAVLLIYLGFILRLVKLSEQQNVRFNQIYGYSVASIFLFHLMINIGMVIGVLPVIGIPLPFFSYGGSSLWGFTLLLFIFLRLDAGQKMSGRRY